MLSNLRFFICSFRQISVWHAVTEVAGFDCE